MFIELHMLQSVPPANLNRDDTNNPKDCEFGGARRARISSQCLKRSVRMAPGFASATKVPNGTRTKRVLGRFMDALTKAGKSADEAQSILEVFIPDYLTKLDRRNPELTDVVVFVSEEELDTATQAMLKEWDALVADPNKAKDISKGMSRRFQEHTSAPDMALFGRMLAAHPEMNLDAACQVAHALSTHRVVMEMDFFTAVDDLQPGDTSGAGMMGFTGYDSACLYRYARIDWDGLVRNLGDDAELARRTVAGFMRAEEEALPSGKQNSFAALTPPNLVLAVVREDGMGWNLVNAFERPVQPDREGGFVGPSAAALDAHWGALAADYGTATLRCVAARAPGGELPLTHLVPHLVQGREAWLEMILSALPAGEDGA